MPGIYITVSDKSPEDKIVMQVATNRTGTGTAILVNYDGAPRQVNFTEVLKESKHVSPRKPWVG